MTPAAKCRRLATMLRAKAEQERDPEVEGRVAVHRARLSYFG